MGVFGPEMMDLFFGGGVWLIPGLAFDSGGF